MAANPRERIPTDYESHGERGWISYAITHQLSKAKVEVPAFYELAERIVDGKNLQNTMSIITQGCGYYLYCNNGNKDLKYTGESTIYRMFLNTELEEVYIGEFVLGRLEEVHKCLVGTKWFEEDPEPYENPVVTGNPVCESLVPPPDTPEWKDPVAIIRAIPDSGQAALRVMFDGKESYDPDGGNIVAYFWEFDEAFTSNEAAPEFTFEQAGEFRVTLQVTDDESATHSTSYTIEVSEATRFTYPPVARIIANKFSGQAPFVLNLDGTDSFDPDGGEIIRYRWSIGEESSSSEAIPDAITFMEAGTYPVSLIVIDDESESDTANQNIQVFSPSPPIDSCWMMSYTLSMCGDSIDTLVQTPIRVPCPGPPEPQIVWTDRDCQQEVPLPRWVDLAESPLQLAGGPMFIRYRGQLPEYALGVNAQIRYRLGRRERFALLLDLSALPIRKATPLDDRPFKWSSLRDSLDPETGLPLVWYRGTRRGTASLGLGAEIAPFKWLYLQGMATVERTFHQEETSDPRKDPENKFIGFDPETFLYEARIGVRKKHLELYIGARYSQENRPFSLIPANDLGGTHNPRWDKTYEAGISIYY